MEFTDLVSRRYSVRSYDPARPVEKAVLERILDAGRLAPTAANRQPGRFLVISSPEMLAKVRASYSKPWFNDAPHVLVLTGKVGDAWSREPDGYNSLETDLTIAMDHMILAAANEGVATCWIAAFHLDVLRSALGLADDEKVFAMTPLGYPRAGEPGTREKKRKPLSEVVRFL
jgi:nitroreductase